MSGTPQRNACVAGTECRLHKFEIQILYLEVYGSNNLCLRNFSPIRLQIKGQVLEPFRDGVKLSDAEPRYRILLVRILDVVVKKHAEMMFHVKIKRTAAKPLVLGFEGQGEAEHFAKCLQEEIDKLKKGQRKSRRLAGDNPQYGILPERSKPAPLYEPSMQQPSNTSKPNPSDPQKSRPVKDAKPRGAMKSWQV